METIRVVRKTINVLPSEKLVVMPFDHRFRSLKERIFVNLEPKRSARTQLIDALTSSTPKLPPNIHYIPNKLKKRSVSEQSRSFTKKRKLPRTLYEERLSLDPPQKAAKLSSSRKVIINDLIKANRDIKQLQEDILKICEEPDIFINSQKIQEDLKEVEDLIKKEEKGIKSALQDLSNIFKDEKENGRIDLATISQRINVSEKDLQSILESNC